MFHGHVASEHKVFRGTYFGTLVLSFKKIKDVLISKAHKKQWQGVHQVMNQEKAGMIAYVDVPQSDDMTVRCNTKLAVEQANGEEIETRFARAGSAPICQEALFQLLGYKIDTDTDIAILEGCFEVLPPHTDGPTLLLLEEMANIW